MRFLLPLLLFITVDVFAQAQLPEVKLPTQAREASLDEIQKLIAEHPDTGILDVRTADEVADLGQIAGSKHLDFFNEKFADEITHLGFDPAKPCVVYCALGGRARRAAAILAQAGFKAILLPSGGFNAWKKAGKPIEGGKPSQ
jgi:rhodanese-related sulfurtransferase